jgi:hypothetical protein
VSHFAVGYHNEAARLGIDLNELYSALLADGELNPPEWNTMGRQVNVYKYVMSPVYDGLELTHLVSGHTDMFPSLYWMSLVQDDRREKAVGLSKQVCHYSQLKLNS